MPERLADHSLEAEPVDVAHRVDQDVQLREKDRLRGVERANPHERDPLRRHGGQRPRLALELGAGEAERHRQRHPVDVAGRRRLRPVHVAVRVDPEHAARPVRTREPTQRPDRDGVVAAEHERVQALFDRARHEVRHPLARLLDRRQEADAFAAHLRRLGNRTLDIAPVENRPAQALDPRREAGIADCRRSHVDAAAPCPEVEARADQGDGPSVRLHPHPSETTLA